MLKKIILPSLSIFLCLFIIFAAREVFAADTSVLRLIAGQGGGPIKFICQYGAVNSNGRLTVRYTWNKDSCDISGSGCGPTSIAMIMSAYGDNYSPADVAIPNSRVGCSDNNTTAAYDIETKFTPWLEKKGYVVSGNLVDWSTGNVNLDAVNKYLNRGYYILGGADVKYMIASGYNDHYAGHAFVVSKANGQDFTEVYDPTFCEGGRYGGLRKLDNVNNQSLNGNDNVKRWIFAFAIKKK